MIRNILLAATALVSVSSVALAADLPSRKAPAAAPYYAPLATTWTGIYIGVSGGGNWGSTNVKDPLGNSLSGSFNLSGALVGGTIGVNYQMGHIVAGLEGDLSWTNKSGRAGNIAPFNPAFAARISESWIATERLRLGYATGPVLLYITGGGAFAGVTNKDIAPAPIASVSQYNRYFGYALGGGVEWRFAPSWTLKAEYLYANLGTRKFFPGVNANNFVQLQRASVVDNIGRIGVNYYFSTPTTAVVAKY